MCGRVLGYMLLEVQLPLGRSKVASEINSCNLDMSPPNVFESSIDKHRVALRQTFSC